MKVSFLINTSEENAYELAKVINSINLQLFAMDLFGECEIKMLDTKECTAQKIKELKSMATGKWACWVNDTEYIHETFVRDVLDYINGGEKKISNIIHEISN